MIKTCKILTGKYDIVTAIIVYLKLTSTTNTMNENKTQLRCKWRNRSVENINFVDWNNQ